MYRDSETKLLICSGSLTTLTVVWSTRPPNNVSSSTENLAPAKRNRPSWFWSTWRTCVRRPSPTFTNVSSRSVWNRALHYVHRCLHDSWCQQLLQSSKHRNLYRRSIILITHWIQYTSYPMCSNFYVFYVYFTTLKLCYAVYIFLN